MQSLYRVRKVRLPECSRSQEMIDRLPKESGIDARQVEGRPGSSSMTWRTLRPASPIVLPQL